MKFTAVLRDSSLNHHHWTVSLQFKRQIHRQKQWIRHDHRGRVWEEEGEEFKDSEPFEKKKGKSPVYFRISKRINTKQNQFKEFRRFKSNLRVKPGKITNLPLRFVQEQQRIPNRCRSVRIRRALVQNRKTLRFSRKRSRFQGLRRIPIVVNQRISEQKTFRNKIRTKNRTKTLRNP